MGEEAKKLYDDAQEMLHTIKKKNWLKTAAVVGIFPAMSSGDDIIIQHNNEIYTSHHLRQQVKKAEGKSYLCLSDYISPDNNAQQDYIGCFAVTAGLGIEEHVRNFENNHDDYSAILLKALADRLAEALAEKTHAVIRKELWGYASKENLSNEDLIREKYRGIRPAPGYPACPEHTEKDVLWKLLNVEEKTGIKLTSSRAMYPAASVSGWYFSHPESKYFGISHIGPDQLKDYSLRKSWTSAEAEKWLARHIE